MDRSLDLVRLGVLLRQRRETRGMTRAQLSRSAGISPSYVALIEDARPRGASGPSRPSPAVLALWTEALGMSDDERDETHRLAGYAPSNGRSPGPTVRDAGAIYRPQARGEDDVVALLQRVLGLARESGDEARVVEVVTVLLRFIAATLPGGGSDPGGSEGNGR